MNRRIEGKFLHTRRGFAFINTGEDKEIFVSKGNIGKALNGDTVLVEIIKEEKENKKAEGKVVKVIQRANTTMVGRVDRAKSSMFVVPNDPYFYYDIFIPKGKDAGAKNNEIVVVEIEDFKKGDKSPYGKVIKRVGNKEDAMTDVITILEEYKIPYKLEKDVRDLLKTIPTHIDSSDIVRREDFRNQKVITIDGDDTKDVDDAVYLENIGEITRLYVHIADVAHYVEKDSVFDMSAYKRSTSVYLIDNVVPMLPREFSNGICSLNEGVDRLTMSVIMDFNELGEITASRITEGVINVAHHMTYTEVQKIIDGDVSEKYLDVLDMIKAMFELSKKISSKRDKMGNIDFDTSEAKFILDEKGIPLLISKYERNSATQLIENFMISANESVAIEYFYREIPFLYRVHEEPAPEKIEKLKKVLDSCNLKLNTQGKLYSGQFKKLLDSVAGKDIESLISKKVLRSMMKARYDVKPLGHFGLGSRYYTHFTSPIRRYADLQIHRIIKDVIHSKLNLEDLENNLSDVAKFISANQKRADDCEREFQKIKKVKYMAKHIGDEYYGNISEFRDSGMYVELDNTVEGLVFFDSIKDDYYYFDQDNYIVRNEDASKTFRVGQRVKVVVSAVNEQLRTIDFEMVKL